MSKTSEQPFRKRTTVQNMAWAEGMFLAAALLRLPDYLGRVPDPPSRRRKRRAFISKCASVPGFCHFDRRTQRKRLVDGLLDIRAHVFRIIAGDDFDLHFELTHLLDGCHHNLKLVHACKLADYVFDGRWINVYTPDSHHVVAAAQEPSVENARKYARKRKE